MCSRRQDFNVNKHHTIRDSQRSAPSYATCIHGRRILLHICLSHKVDNDQASLQGSQLLLSMQNSTTFNEATFKDHSGYAALISKQGEHSVNWHGMVWYGILEFNVPWHSIGHFGDGDPEQWCAICHEIWTLNRLCKLVWWHPFSSRISNPHISHKHKANIAHDERCLGFFYNLPVFEQLYTLRE